MTDEWQRLLEGGRSDAAWDLFLTRYRRVVFAAIRHYAQDYDDVMDVFAHVCERLREDDLRRLRSYLAEPAHTAKFTTWLVTVVRHLAVDWFRRRDGRQRLPALAARLPPLQRRIFELVFLDGRTHLETYELIRSAEAPGLSFGEYLRQLRATYRDVADKRRGRILFDLAGPMPTDLEQHDWAPPDAETLQRAVRCALASLSAEDRVTLQLYVLEELPAEQVATVVGLPNAKAVYNRVYRALAQAREHLERAGIRWEDLQ